MNAYENRRILDMIKDKNIRERMERQGASKTLCNSDAVAYTILALADLCMSENEDLEKYSYHILEQAVLKARMVERANEEKSYQLDERENYIADREKLVRSLSEKNVDMRNIALAEYFMENAEKDTPAAAAEYTAGLARILSRTSSEKED